MYKPFQADHFNFIPRIATLFFLVGCLICYSTGLTARQIDVGNIMPRDSFPCQNLAMSMTRLIPQYHQDNRPDTLDAMLAYWQEQCGGPEPMVRFRIIHQIEQSVFSDDWYPDNILDLLFDYRAMVTEFEGQPYYFDYFLGEYLLIDSGFSEFTANLATHLTRYTDLQPIESFFLEFYSRRFDLALERLASGGLAGTRIDSLFFAEQPDDYFYQEPVQPQEPYQEESVSHVSKRQKFRGAYLGLWMPTGNLAVIGNHLQLGYFRGSMRNRFMTNFYFMMGLVEAAEEYHVVVDNTLYSTQGYFGILIGFDLGTIIPVNETGSLIPSFGIAYEGFEAFTMYEQETFGLSKVIGSINLNIGWEYRIKITPRNYLGFLAKYHILNYLNEGGTDLAGNAASFGITIGFGR